MNSFDCRVGRTMAIAWMAVLVAGVTWVEEARGHVRNGPSVDACSSTKPADVWPAGVLNFETPQCNPIALSRRGRLYVTDTPRHRLLELDTRGRVRRELRVGLEPSGVAASPDGRTLYVTNHLSDSISVIDAKRWQVVDTIQRIDPATRLSELDEPCGVAFSPTEPLAFVTLSQPNRLAVIDTATHTIERILDIGGEDPRAVTVSADGSTVFVAAFESGNQTEVEIDSEEVIYGNGEFWWHSFLELVATIAGGTSGGEISTPAPGANLPARPDDDVFVIDTSTWAVTPVSGVGTLLYGLAAEANDLDAIWVAGTAHQNFLDGPQQLQGRPILNQLTRLSAASGPLGWQNPERRVIALDEDNGQPVAGGAVPFALARTQKGEMLVTAASSDRLVIVGRNGRVRARVVVGSMPRGVVTRGNRAWVYNRGDSTISVINIRQAVETNRLAFSSDPLPADVVEGRRLFYDARFSGNGTFSCASCHPDAHTDHLVWSIGEGNRNTQTLRGIAGTEQYHWSGSQATAQILINGGVTGPVFGGSILPCEVEAMARFMESVSFPPSPFRPPTDLMSDDARFGAALVRRGVWVDEEDRPLVPLRLDPGFEEMIREEAGQDVAPSRAEGCAISGCHTAPLWTASGTGGENFIQAVTFRGMWDRNTWVHHGTSSKVANLEAASAYRELLGYEPTFTGISDARASSAAFFATFFRSHEGNLPDPLLFHPKIEAFLNELGTGVPGVLGRQVLWDGTPIGDETESLQEIVTAAVAGKVTLRVTGQAGGGSVDWTWQPWNGTWLTPTGTLTQADVVAILQSATFLLLVTADLPLNTETKPLLRTVVVQGETVIAEAKNGENQTFEFRGENFLPGMWLLVDGFRYVQPLVIDSNTALLVETPVNAPAGFYVLSLLNPNGLASNEFPIPVTGEPTGPDHSFQPLPPSPPMPLG
ncbi:MAG: cytochrome c peroxidase [Planctomycetota bacterium]|nr:cytochrome c peroxidase [Planctomycetota bacterium]